MSGSETESDSSQSKLPVRTDVLHGHFSKWDPRNPIWSNNPSSGGIEDVQALLQLDVSSLIEKPELMDDVLVSSAKLLNFLADVTADFSGLLGTFSALVHEAFLRRMFEYRAFFREVALQLDGAQRRIETWIDEFLVRLCQSIEFYASGCRDLERPHLVNDSIRLHQQKMLFQACSQLPERWCDLKSALTTQQYSPAAKRLAITLLFGAHVMASRLLPVTSLPSTRSTEFLDELFIAAKHSRAFDRQSSVMMQDSYDERLTAAMLISLVAISDKMKSISNALKLSQLRPEGLGYLLDLIRLVMMNKDESRPIYMPKKLDVPQTILLRWGDAVPWSWSIWDDQRIANIEDLHSMTATWVYHVNKPIFEHLVTHENAKIRQDFLDSVLTDTTASSAMILLLLHKILDILTSATDDAHSPPDSALLDILKKLCWAFVQILENYTLQGNPPTLGIQLPEYVKCYLLLFCNLPSFGDTVSEVRNLILEGLLLVPRDAIHLGLRSIANNKASQFFRKLEQVINVCTNTSPFLVLSQPTVQGSPDIGNTEYIVSLLHFLTILSVHDQTETRPLRDIITSGFQMVINFMKTKLPDVTPLVIPLLTTAVVIPDYATVASIMDYEAENMWSWSIHTSGCQMIRAALFSRYLLGTDRLVGDPLLHHEACELLVSTLASILEPELAEDPLALLTCSNICAGLVKLIGSVEKLTRERILSSPWVVHVGNNLVSRMADNSISETSYRGQVNKKLSVIGKYLVEAIFGRHFQSRLTTLDGETDVKLLYYRDSQYTGLLLVDEYSLKEA